MALSTYLTLKLNNTAVQGGVIQTGRVGMIEVTSLDWSFDSDDNVGEIKFTAEIDKAIVPISAGLKSDAVADALFDFWEPNRLGTAGGTGTETKMYTLHGTNGRVTSVNVWMINNKDPNLMRYPTTIQYTMSFAAIEQTWLSSGAAVTIP